MKLFVCLLLAATASSAAFAGAAPFDHNHTLFNQLLRKRVKNGRVDYRAIKKSPGNLDKYLAQLAAVTADQVKHWSREEQLAYWINAYNAFTIKSIVDHYPIKRNGLLGLAFPANSIRQIAGVWDKKKWRAGGELLTLDQIEQEKLRSGLKDPRIHFAINCASVGCPELSSQAFRAADIDQQLAAAAKRFITNPAKVKLVDHKLYLSKIFQWFSQDFARFDQIDGYGKYDGVVTFVMNRLPEDQRQSIVSGKPTIEWLDYDWSLNQQK